MIGTGDVGRGQGRVREFRRAVHLLFVYACEHGVEKTQKADTESAGNG